MKGLCPVGFEFLQGDPETENDFHNGPVFPIPDTKTTA
jgi:hypothetical protein